MLEYLRIRNLALIEDMALEFTDGINVLTGETGAGKSFILKAIAFVLGDKFSADIVRPGAEKAQVEALFHLKDQDVVLRRELSAATGRGRLHLNDAIITQDALRDLRSRLVSHTSQHAQQQLLQPARQASLLEKYFTRPDLLAQKDELLSQLRLIAEKYDALLAKQATLAEKRELLEMQNAEIEKIAPREGEEEELEEIRATARARQGELQNLRKATALLHGDDSPGLIPLLTEFERLLDQMAKADPHLSPSVENMETFRQELVQLANDFRRPQPLAKKIDMDAIESRLFALAQLKRKLKRTMPQILALRTEIQNNLSFLDVCALDLAKLNREREGLETRLKEVVEEIKPIREDAAQKFAGLLETQLRDLGFSEHVRVSPEFMPDEIWPGITDERGQIFWAPNPGQKPQPLDKIASGGELSRFLLGLNTVDNGDSDTTYIFDEVDAGVGGLTLNKVADKLSQFSQKHQIILITHWPQLAVKAQKHFQITKTVEKGNTFTRCAPLNGGERAAEIARMAGGGKEGKAMALNLLSP